MSDDDKTLEEKLAEYEEKGEEELADYTRDLIAERDEDK